MSWSNFISKIKPDGKAFRNISYTKYLYEVVAYGLKLVSDYAIYTINDQIWYVNDNFNPEPWENRYSINVPVDATLEQRREVVKSYMLYPQSDNRLCLQYLQLQLDNAGFEEVTISRNPTGAAYSKLHGNNITDTENYTIGSEPYNSILISGNLSSDYYRDMIILMMSIKPLDTAVYDTVTSDIALAFAGSDFTLAISGTLNSIIGEFGQGNEQFISPSGIAINDTNIFICDRENKRIQVLDLEGNFDFEFYDNEALAINDTSDYTLAFNDGVDDFALAVSQTFDACGIVLNSTNIYVTDSINNQIFIFDLSGNYVDKFGSSGTGNGEFNEPTGMAIDDNYLYVCDSGNNRIQVFDLDGVYVSQFGSSGTGNSEFDNPIDISVNASNIYVCDSGNNRIQIFDLAGTYIDQFGSLGSDVAEFNNPIGITIDSNYIYVCDKNNGRVQMFDLSGNYDFKFNTSEKTDTNYNNINYIVGNDNNLFITDFNHLVKKYDKQFSLAVNQI